MRISQILTLPIFVFLVSCGSKEIEPPGIALPEIEVFTTQTYVIKWSGDESLKTRTMKKLVEKKCWIIKEVIPATSESSTECHEFIEYKNKSDVHGPYKKIGSSVMLQVKAEKHEIFKVQLFSMEKKKLHRIKNLGKFVDPDDFAETLKQISFK